MLRITRLVVGYVSTNCYIAYDQEAGTCVIVDPGDSAERIKAKIEELEVRPEAVLLTHGHFDHIMAVPDIRRFYPEIPVYAYNAERILLSDAAMNESNMIKKPLILDDISYLEDGGELELVGHSWRVISTPGHTIGSCCYYIVDAAVLFSGDTLFDGDCGRTDLATGDTGAIIHSIRDILMRLPDETQVLPGHETFTTIGRERIQNVVMRMG